MSHGIVERRKVLLRKVGEHVENCISSCFDVAGGTTRLHPKLTTVNSSARPKGIENVGKINRPMNMNQQMPSTHGEWGSPADRHEAASNADKRRWTARGRRCAVTLSQNGYGVLPLC